MLRNTPDSQDEIVDDFDWLAFEAELHADSSDDELSPSLLRSIESISDVEIDDEEEPPAPAVVVPTPAPAPAPVADDRLAQLVQAAERIGAEDLALERELMQLKWIDYKFLTPLAATMEFARCYREAFRNAFRRDVDRDWSEHVQGINLDRILSDRVKDRRRFTALWRARQRADRLGMAYDRYIALTFEFHSRAGLDRKFFARPNQLIGSEKAEQAWLRTVPSSWRTGLHHGGMHESDLPQYRVENYRGLPAQDSYRAFMIELAKETTDPHYFMQDRALQRPSVPLLAFRESGHGLLKAGIRFMKGEKQLGRIKYEPHPDLDTADLRQSCFGVPHAQDMKSEPCSACPQRGACAAMADAVLAQLEADHGSVNPVADRKNALNRERVRACRARAKARKAETA